MNTPWLSRLSSDEALSFEGEDRPVGRWQRDLEVAPHFAFGERSLVDACVGINEGKILAYFSENLGSDGAQQASVMGFIRASFEPRRSQ